MAVSVNLMLSRVNISKLSESSLIRGVSRTAATSKMECFVIILNGFQPLTINTKRSILDVTAVLDPPLLIIFNLEYLVFNFSIILKAGANACTSHPTFWFECWMNVG